MPGPRGTRLFTIQIFCILLSVQTVSCKSRPPATAPSRPTEPLHVEPATDLVPAAALRWLVDIRPRDLWQNREARFALSDLFPSNRLRAFSRRYGVADLSELRELVFAGYADTMLVLGAGFVEPSSVETAFKQRADVVEGRAIDGDHNTESITRLWGTVRGERQQIAVFDHRGVGLEIGRFGPLKAAEFFALRRLRKASPALHAVPLAQIVGLIKGAPVAAFAPGPFDGEWAHALGGLLASASAVAIGAEFIAAEDRDLLVDPPRVQSTALVRFTLVLSGNFDRSPREAETRLLAAFDRFAQTSLGHLLGVDQPSLHPVAKYDREALTLTFALHASSLAEGIRDATDASVSEMMQH